MELPLEQTSFPGVYRCGARLVAVYRRGGRRRKESAASFAEAREIKLARDAEARAERRGPTLHAFALGWLDRYAGSGCDSVREGTRREYRRLLSTSRFATSIANFGSGSSTLLLSSGSSTGSPTCPAETAASRTARLRTR